MPGGNPEALGRAGQNFRVFALEEPCLLCEYTSSKAVLLVSKRALSLSLSRLTDRVEFVCRLQFCSSTVVVLRGHVRRLLAHSIVLHCRRAARSIVFLVAHLLGVVVLCF